MKQTDPSISPGDCPVEFLNGFTNIVCNWESSKCGNVTEYPIECKISECMSTFVVKNYQNTTVHASVKSSSTMDNKCIDGEYQGSI